MTNIHRYMCICVYVNVYACIRNDKNKNGDNENEGSDNNDDNKSNKS